jgi:uncharacterized protein DUF4136
MVGARAAIYQVADSTPLSDQEMNMRFVSSLSQRLALAAVLGTLTGTAFSQSVNTNYMPGTDFSKYHSYKWVAVDGAQQVDQILDQQIKGAVDKQLAAKGLTKKDADPVDMFVGYQVAMDHEKELNAWGGGMGWRMGGGMGTVTTTTVDIGTVALDLYDPANKQLLWRGTVSDTVHKSTSPEKRQEHFDKAMGKLLKKFPPPAK